MRARIVALSLAIVLASIVLSQTAAPRFADYPAIGSYRGKNSAVVLGKDEREFRTRLRSAARQTPNFAGHYIVSTWGCGAECLTGAVIDANTGEVKWLPDGICCWGAGVDRPIEFRLNSRLIVFVGERGERPDDQGTHYYEFRGGTFVYITSHFGRRQ
jgi:hypothetical protein